MVGRAPIYPAMIFTRGMYTGSPEYGSHASVNEQPQPFPAGQLTWKGHAVESPLLACAFARAVAAAALSAQGAVSNEAAAPAAEMGSELKTGCRPDAGPSPQLSASTDITSNGRSNGHAVLMQQWLPRLLPCSVSMQPHQLTSNTHWAGVLPRVVVACALMEGGTSAINALVQQCLMHLPLYGQAAGCQATYTPLDTSNTGTSGTTVLVLELAGQGLFSSQRAQQQQGAQQQQAHRGLTLGRAFALSVLACACRLAPHSLSGAAGCEMVRVFGSLHGVEDAWGAAGVRHLQGSSWPAPAAGEHD